MRGQQISGNGTVITYRAIVGTLITILLGISAFAYKNMDERVTKLQDGQQEIKMQLVVIQTSQGKGEAPITQTLSDIQKSLNQLKDEQKPKLGIGSSQ
jgi:hypothetical protein